MFYGEIDLGPWVWVIYTITFLIYTGPFLAGLGLLAVHFTRSSDTGIRILKMLIAYFILLLPVSIVGLADALYAYYQYFAYPEFRPDFWNLLFDLMPFASACLLAVIGILHARRKMKAIRTEL